MGKSAFVLSRTGFGLACATMIAAASAAEVIGKVSQPIVVGDLVTVERQSELGLVVLPGCSGTLINRYWVLTADHCITTDGKRGGPASAFANVPISAAWSKKTVIPTRFVRYWSSNRLDVALVFLGGGDFGPTARKLIYQLDDVDSEMTLAKFGRGVFAYATGSGPTATPSQSDGAYRTAFFKPSVATRTSITLPANDRGQVGNGGDSGGPDYVTGAGGVAISIVSVQSTCSPIGHVAGKPKDWTWATGVSACHSAALAPIRDDIYRVMKEKPILVVDSGAVVTKKPNKVVGRDQFDDFDVVARNSKRTDILVDKPGGVVQAAARCKSGYVWRAARPSDVVCVTPAVRARTAQENALASSRVNPAGAYGPNTCLAGYVWRGAFEGDAVCVTPDIRTQVSEDNSLAKSRRIDN